MLIDAHVHVWALARGDYAWLTPDLPMLYRDFALADYHAATADLEIGGLILVQAAPTLAETRWLLGIADHDPWVRGVIGWIDFTDPGAAGTLPALQTRGLVGVRPMLHDLAPVDWVLEPAFTPVFDALAESGLVFDALIRPAHLPTLAALAARHPGLAIVVDHLAKPAIAARAWQPWADDIAALAAFPNVSAKISGMVTEARAGDAEMLAPYVTLVLAAFGGERLIWGSDWPVVTPHATIGEWHDICRELLPRDTHGNIFGGNARRVYRLETL